MKNNDYDMVKDQMNWIRANYFRFNNINFFSNNKIETDNIGCVIKTIKISDYEKEYSEIINNNNYSIQLIDGSIINYFYAFQKNKLISHTLSYIPSINDYDDENVIVAKYIRIDYKESSHKSIFHTYVHMHIGLYDTGLRIPVAHALYPKEFLYIILKYVYNSVEPALKLLVENRKKDLLLNEEEKDKLRIVFGQDNTT